MDIGNKSTLNFHDKRITVIGMGLSGLGAAKLAKHFGAQVLISDPGNSDTMKLAAKECHSIGIKVEIGGHTNRIYSADLWVVSPGVPKEAKIIQKALSQSIPVVGEIEFASWFTSAPILAVTGSNGKTTTASALAHMCQTDSIHGILAGNIGSAFSHNVLDELLHPDNKRVYVLEISSFQMEFIVHFKPHVAVFLNISPDHLDRHKSMEAYTKAKLDMSKNLGGTDTIVYNADDPILREAFHVTHADKKTFGLHALPTHAFSVNTQNIYDKNKKIFIKIDEIHLPGPHNLANLVAAATAAKVIGISDEHIQHVFRSFTAIEHRLENVAYVDGVNYINDSKATNIDAVIVALNSFSQPIILILGGKDKGADFTQLLPHTHNVKAVLAYGQARGTIATALADAVRLSIVEGLKDAVHLSHQLASSGDIVLLSPGCASFDQFKNYEERGRMFKEWANALESTV